MPTASMEARPRRGLPRRIARSVRDTITTAHVLLVFATVERRVRQGSAEQLARRLGCPIETTAPGQVCEGKPVLDDHAIRQIRCVRRVARRWPFGSGPCLRTSLVAGHLLRRHHPVIRLGTIGSGASLSAHAWLEFDGRPLQPMARYRQFSNASDIA